MISPTVRVAAVDLDGTLLDGQSQVIFIRFLARRGAVPVTLLWYVLFAGMLYRFGRRLDFAAMQRRVVARFAGMDVSRLRRLTEECIEAEILPRIRRDGTQEIAALHQAGAHVILVSAATHMLVEGVGAQVGTDGIVATRLDVPTNGRLSGLVDGAMLSGAAKLHALRAHADAVFGAGNWRLWRAYGDHESDIDLLEAADEAVAVCPSSRLLTIANERGWKTIEWQ